MTTPMKEQPRFGELLFEYRQRAHSPMSRGSKYLTQGMLAELVSTSHATIGNYETGTSRPNNRDMVILLVRALVRQGGIKTVEEANDLLRSGGYASVSPEEQEEIFDKPISGSPEGLNRHQGDLVSVQNPRLQHVEVQTEDNTTQSEPWRGSDSSANLLPTSSKFVNESDEDLAQFFTGGEFLLNKFAELIAAPEHKKREVIIYGVGGVGKSSLLHMFRRYCWQKRVPVAIASGTDANPLMSVLKSWAVEFEKQGILMPTFLSASARIQELNGQVFPQGLRFQTTVVQAPVRIKLPSHRDLAGIEVGGLSASTTDAVGIEAMMSWLPNSLSYADTRLLLDPEEALASCFLVDLGRLVAQQRVVLLLDTFEQLSAYDGQFRKLVEQMPSNVLLVVAGRLAPNWGRNHSSEEQREVYEVELRGLADEEVRELVHKYSAFLHGKQPDAHHVDAIVQSAHGLPLAVTAVVDLWLKYNMDPVAIGPAGMANVVDKMLDGIPNALHPYLEAAAILRGFNRSMLRAIIGMDNSSLYDELRRLPFSRPHREGFALHDIMRQILGEHLHAQDPAQFRDLHARAADYFASCLENEEDEALEHCQVEYLYHAIFANERIGLRRFQEVAEELVHLRRIHRLRALLSDAQSYELKRINSRHWREYYAGELARLEGRSDDALQIYQPLILSESDDVKLRAYVLYSLGTIYKKTLFVSQPGGLARAKQAIQQSLELLPASDPRYILNYASLGEAFVRVGEIEQAISSLDRVVDHCQQHNDTYGACLAYKMLQDVYARSGDWPNMFHMHQQSLNALLSSANRSSAYTEIRGQGMLAWNWAGRYAEAEQNCRVWIQTQRDLGGGDITGHLRDLTYSLGVQGKYQEAQGYYNECLEVHHALHRHEDAMVMGHWGYILSRQGEHKLSEELLKKSYTLRLQYEDLPGLPEVLTYLGQLYEMKHGWDEAEQAYLQSLEYRYLNRHNFECVALVGLQRVKYAQHDTAAIPVYLMKAEQLAQRYEYNDYLSALRLIQGHMAWDTGQSPFIYYQQALIHALRFNRFLLDELLLGPAHNHPSLFTSIITRCLMQGDEGSQQLLALREWWLTGTNDIGISRPDTISPIPEGVALQEGEQLARKREPGTGEQQQTIVEQLNHALQSTGEE